MGEHYYGEKNFSQAVAVFRSFLANYPDSHLGDEARYWLGESLLGEGNFCQARAEFQKFLTDFPRSDFRLQAEFRMGHCLAREGKHKEAVEVYEKLLQEQPENFLAREIKLGLGEAWEGLEEWDRAVEVYRKIVRGSSDEMAAEAQFRAAAAYEKGENFKEATIGYLKAVYFHSDFPDWVLRAKERAGLCLERQEKWEDAKRIYEKLLQADPEGVKGKSARERLRWIEENKSGIK